MTEALQTDILKRVSEMVNRFLVEEFEVDPSVLKPDADMRQTLDLDSLDYVDMVVIIENLFGFKMKAEDFQNIRSLQDFYHFIARHQTSLG
ncbi:MAG: phosphopantetheine-binding protein [Flavobacteriales bacterium]|nr:phosphopantetheine-binding protein [Flavobacteriales bacterium]